MHTMQHHKTNTYTLVFILLMFKSLVYNMHTMQYHKTNTHFGFYTTNAHLEQTNADIVYAQLTIFS